MDGKGLATFSNYPALGLKAARERRAEALELLTCGQDPTEAAKVAKLEAANARTNTFEALAREWHAACSRKWSPGHAETVLRRMELHLFPTLGARPVADLKACDLQGRSRPPRSAIPWSLPAACASTSPASCARR
ncbi:tyrosine-type recombinase/integrase [Azotobacter vinelandii]